MKGRQAVLLLGKASTPQGEQVASSMLNREGIGVIKYPSGTLSGITDSPYFNYVIFNPEDITIERMKKLGGEWEGVLSDIAPKASTGKKGLADIELKPAKIPTRAESGALLKERGISEADIQAALDRMKGKKGKVVR